MPTMEALLHYLLNFGNSVFDFFIGTIILKIIVAHWASERLIKMYRRLLRSERKRAILDHYAHRHHGSVRLCLLGKCALI